MSYNRLRTVSKFSLLVGLNLFEEDSKNNSKTREYLLSHLADGQFKDLEVKHTENKILVFLG